MENYVDEGLHELVVHGKNDFKADIYGDSYFYCKMRFYYTHYHEEYEIITAEKGNMRVDVGTSTYILSEHEFLLVNSNSIHTIVHNEYPDSISYTYLFHPSLLHTQGSTRIEGSVIEPILEKSFEAIKIKDEDIYQELKKVHDEKISKDKNYPIDYLIILYRIISYLYRNYEALKPKEISSHSNEKIQKALNYIYTNFSKLITVSDIAKIMDLSDGEASRLFKKMTGKSIMDYVISYRITMADYYLKSTDKSITDIAFLCGFSSSNYFTIAFKKINGMTPKEYRKQ